MLTVKVYADAEAIASNEGVRHEVAFVSLVNNQTYGPPALVAPAPPNARDKHRAEPGEEVLYINTNLVPMYKIVETDD